MSRSGVLWLDSAETNPRRQNNVIQQLMQGRTNATGDFTLTANSTSTVVTSQTCGPSSVIVWMPTTTNAASQMATLSCATVAARTFTLTHASNANIDQSFKYIVLG